MLSRRIAVGLMVAVVAGLLSVAFPTNVVPGAAQASTPTIQTGEMFFAVPGGPQVSYPPGTPPENILTISGAADGVIELIVENVGTVKHEIRSPLFMATKEVKAEIFDSNDNLIAEVEGTDLLELELMPGFKAELKIELAGAITKSLAKDPDNTMTFEISCHVEGHYEAGMRALITVAP